MKLTGYKMDCYVKAVLDVESVARATGSTPEQYDEVL